jgi:hypothetical protein
MRADDHARVEPARCVERSDDCSTCALRVENSNRHQRERLRGDQVAVLRAVMVFSDHWCDDALIACECKGKQRLRVG